MQQFRVGAVQDSISAFSDAKTEVYVAEPDRKRLIETCDLFENIFSNQQACRCDGGDFMRTRQDFEKSGFP